MYLPTLFITSVLATSALAAPAPTHTTKDEHVKAAARSAELWGHLACKYNEYYSTVEYKCINKWWEPEYETEGYGRVGKREWEDDKKRWEAEQWGYGDEEDCECEEDDEYCEEYDDDDDDDEEEEDCECEDDDEDCEDDEYDSGYA